MALTSAPASCSSWWPGLNARRRRCCARSARCGTATRSGSSGFYLALMIVLWLLILRGIAIEFRNHIDNPLWKPAWDTVFGGASAVLAFVFGVALGNVVRGVPLDAQGYFFLPLWTNLVP